MRSSSMLRMASQDNPFGMCSVVLVWASYPSLNNDKNHSHYTGRNLFLFVGIKSMYFAIACQEDRDKGCIAELWKACDIKTPSLLDLLPATSL